MVAITLGLPGGYRNINGTFNNIGNNGNWWSSTENNTNNAWNRNLNYSNGNVNRNNNNKTNGFSVRCLRDLKEAGPCVIGGFFIMQFELFSSIDYSKLTEEIFTAYFDCRKNKRNTLNALKFEKHFEQYLFVLIDEIYAGTYTPGRSIAFIVNKPVKREIFAADFRDRVVHHWLINKLNPLFEKLFIEDSYACRVGKGTHYGIKHADGFIKACSENYIRDCYILKLDVQGFFMHIHRGILFDKLSSFVALHYQGDDQSLVMETARKIIFNNPTHNCIIKGSEKDWEGLPRNKSLFHCPPDCGLPIGNLTSQVFANFYMHDFDAYIKSHIGIKYYGRYVDDFILIHEDKSYLKSLIPQLSYFLLSTLQLRLHPKKMYLQHYTKGVKFLGTVIKPNRIYIAHRTKGNFFNAIQKQNHIIVHQSLTKEHKVSFLSSMNSYLGIMMHYKTFRLRKKMLHNNLHVSWWDQVYISSEIAKFSLNINPTGKNNPFLLPDEFKAQH